MSSPRRKPACIAVARGHRPRQRHHPRQARLGYQDGEIETKGPNRRRVPVPAILRDYLDEHLLGLEWSEGLVFGVSPLSPFDPRTITRRSMAA
jgi:hypothetical protein